MTHSHLARRRQLLQALLLRLQEDRGCLLVALVHHQQHCRRRLLYLGASTLLRKMRQQLRKMSSASTGSAQCSMHSESWRSSYEMMLFVGTRFSNLYTIFVAGSSEAGPELGCVIRECKRVESDEPENSQLQDFLKRVATGHEHTLSTG